MVKKRQMKMSSMKVKLAESESGDCIECLIGVPYQDWLNQNAVKPAADMEEQLRIAVRDLGPVKGLTRPVVKTQPSHKTRV